MMIRNADTLLFASVLMASGLLLACVDNGHVLGDVVAAGAGEAGSTHSVGGTEASGGKDQRDAGHSAGTDARPSGGRTESPPGGSAGSAEPSSGTGGSAHGDGGSANETGGVPGGVGGRAGGTAGTGGSAAGTGGSTTGSSCGGYGGNLSISIGQADQYACCASNDDCHLLYDNCSCAAVSTQVTELIDGVICDTNSCAASGAVCQSEKCTLVLDTGGTGGTTAGTGGTTGGTGGSTTDTCGGGDGGNLSIPFGEADQYACCASNDDCHVLYTNCSCAAVSTQVTELMDWIICNNNSCSVPDREPPRAVCETAKCTLVVD